MPSRTDREVPRATAAARYKCVHSCCHAPGATSSIIASADRAVQGYSGKVVWLRFTAQLLGTRLAPVALLVPRSRANAARDILAVGA
jgi:hypothetical protein